MDPQTNKLMDGVGKRRVRIVDEDSGEDLASGVLKGIRYEVGEADCVSEAVVAVDFPKG